MAELDTSPVPHKRMLNALRRSPEWRNYKHLVSAEAPVEVLRDAWTFMTFPGVVTGRPVHLVFAVAVKWRRPYVCVGMFDGRGGFEWSPAELAQVRELSPERRFSSRDMLIRGLASLAAVLAGPRHSHLREAWAADQYDPETGELLPSAKRLRLAAGDMAAALRCRVDDAAALAWRPVDALLASWHWSRLAVSLPITVAAGLVLSREGFYALIADADNLGVIAVAPTPPSKGCAATGRSTRPSALRSRHPRTALSSSTPDVSSRGKMEP